MPSWLIRGTPLLNKLWQNKHHLSLSSLVLGTKWVLSECFVISFKDKKEPDAKIAKTEEEEEAPDKEEEEKSTKAPAGSSKSGWKNWKKTKESDSGGEESKITYCHWLLKSEPESRLEKGVDVKFSIEDLKAQPNQTTFWDGVRNYQARNFLRAMKLGQQAFFYHSNCKEPGIVGIVKIVKEAYPDHTQFDQKNPHYDSSSRKENPKWSMVM